LFAPATKNLAVPGWEGNIIISPQEIECEGVGPIQMAQDKVLGQASIGPIMDGECLSSEELWVSQEEFLLRGVR
jgi:hypothetical protein